MNSMENAYQNTAAVQTSRLIKNVYLWMTLGLGLTGVVAYGVSGNVQLVRTVATGPLFWVLIIGELALVWTLSARVMKMSVTAATLAFGAYAFLNGLTLSVIFLAYTGETIATAFFVSAGMFGTMSLWAMTTKKDLSGFGQYLFMGLIGIIIASVVNIFLNSSGLSYLISYAGVFLFLGLTAYDTQQIQRMAAQFAGTGEDNYVRLSIMGALKLYLDFINLFLFLLRIFGRES